MVPADKVPADDTKRALSRGAIVLALTFVSAVVLALAEAPPVVVALEGLAGIFVFGLVLWWIAGRRWVEIGEAIMVAVLLAVVLGIPQFLINADQKQREATRENAQKQRDAERAAAEKERDFRLSLALQKDLSGINLEGRNLVRVRLVGKTLRNANLRGADLRAAQLTGSNLRGADLEGADLRKADLRHAKLGGAWMANADLRGANLEDADAPGVAMPGANVSGANLEITGLKFSCFAKADLRGARLTGADMAHSVLTGSDLRGVDFESDLKPARIGFAGLANAVVGGTRWPVDFSARRVTKALAGIPVRQRLEPSPRPATGLIAARVIEVTDGDTLRVRVDKQFRGRLQGPGRTRLIGVDAADLKTAGGREAKRQLQRRVLGRRVLIEIGSDPMDKRDRYFVYVWSSPRQTLNERMLSLGLVSLKLRENRGRSRELQNAELRARQGGRGIWQSCPRPGSLP